MTRPIRIFHVRPRVPDRLWPLYELVYNLLFVWNYDAGELFRRINLDLWQETRKNPVEVLVQQEGVDRWGI